MRPLAAGRGTRVAAGVGESPSNYTGVALRCCCYCHTTRYCRHTRLPGLCRTLSISLSLFTRRNQCLVERGSVGWVKGSVSVQVTLAPGVSPIATFDRPCCHRILNEKRAVQVHHQRRNRSDGMDWNFQVCGPSRPWVPVNCVVSHSQ